MNGGSILIKTCIARALLLVVEIAVRSSKKVKGRAKNFSLTGETCKLSKEAGTNHVRKERIFYDASR
jgi:hypothetical protein